LLHHAVERVAVDPERDGSPALVIFVLAHPQPDHPGLKFDHKLEKAPTSGVDYHKPIQWLALITLTLCHFQHSPSKSKPREDPCGY
jgi:hypothetical protein